MRITMIGHSTVLIEADGKKILTDPYWGKWGNLAYARLGIPAKSRQELREVDGVLISHDHWDHVDGKYLRLLGNTPVIVPQPTRWIFKLLGGRNVSGIKVWESITIGEITITAVPAVHMTIAMGFMLQCKNKRIYFAGDTFYSPFMQDLGRKFQFDVALMPVTTYRIPMTMGEKQAVQAVRVLKPTVVIPIHLGIKPRSPLLRTNQTPEHFEQRLDENGIESKVVILQEGESYTI
jgi:L-ascorbate metabolism protein UlaG (beta-lactamase superfamily)